MLSVHYKKMDKMWQKYITEYYTIVRFTEQAILRGTWAGLKNKSKKIRNRVPSSVSHTLSKAIKSEKLGTAFRELWKVNNSS